MRLEQPDRWMAWADGVNQERLPAPAPDMKLLVCGPPPMVSAMKKATASLGYEAAKPVSKLADQVFCF